jgi:hypothetical protein
MQTIMLRLNPEKLANPDLDIRYVLPDLLVEKSNSLIIDNGYDYEDFGNRAMLLYLQTNNLEKALVCINDLITNTKVLDNDLSDAVEIILDK